MLADAEAVVRTPDPGFPLHEAVASLLRAGMRARDISELLGIGTAAIMAVAAELRREPAPEPPGSAF